MLNLRPDLAPIFEALGESAIVTVPATVPAPVAATVVRDHRAAGMPPGGRVVTEMITTFALRRTEIPVAPSGTTIVIGAETWTVDSVSPEGPEDDEIYTVVAH